jgi:hypothetical protein
MEAAWPSRTSDHVGDGQKLVAQPPLTHIPDAEKVSDTSELIQTLEADLTYER